MMEDVEYNVLTEWFNWIVNNLDLNIDLIGKYTFFYGLEFKYWKHGFVFSSGSFN